MPDAKSFTIEELLGAVADANAAINDMAVLFLGIEGAGIQVVDKVELDDAWIGTAIKSMSEEGGRIADRFLGQCAPLLQRAAQARDLPIELQIDAAAATDRRATPCHDENLCAR